MEDELIRATDGVAGNLHLARSRNDMCLAWSHMVVRDITDGQWYRARVEKVYGSKISVFYIDYGNRENVEVSQCAALPSGFAADKAYAHEYAMACVQLPKDVRTL
jgi:hypothetical protein